MRGLFAEIIGYNWWPFTLCYARHTIYARRTCADIFEGIVMSRSSIHFATRSSCRIPLPRHHVITTSYISFFTIFIYVIDYTARGAISEESREEIIHGTGAMPMSVIFDISDNVLQHDYSWRAMPASRALRTPARYHGNSRLNSRAHCPYRLSSQLPLLPHTMTWSWRRVILRRYKKSLNAASPASCAIGHRAVTTTFRLRWLVIEMICNSYWLAGREDDISGRWMVTPHY